MTNQNTVNEKTGNTHTKPERVHSGCRIVHVSVAESSFNHAKAQAYLSGISWAKFIEQLLENSTPVSDSNSS